MKRQPSFHLRLTNRKAYNSITSTSPKIVAIKAVRHLTGLGLADAKELVERAISSEGATFTRQVEYEDPENIPRGENRSKLMNDLASVGFIGHMHNDNELIERLAELTTDAVENKEYNFAHDLLEVLGKYDH